MTTIEPPYLLLTPGPLTTSHTVKTAMLADWCTWDNDYNQDIVQSIRASLIELATGNKDNTTYTSVLLQGSGSYAVEAAIGSFIADTDKPLLISNGAYGQRIQSICDYYRINYHHLTYKENEIPDLDAIESALVNDKTITHVIAVHCETTSGILNPIADICALAKRYNKITLIDAMSSFGGIEMSIDQLAIDVLISSANKCIQGVPGFAFVICKQALLTSKGHARSLSLDLHAQWQTMHQSGKWRFTSPTHTVRAFLQALIELEAEGGIPARAKRYRENQIRLVEGMIKNGFEPLVERSLQSPVITSFRYPDTSFNFLAFYTALKAKGFVIYPGKITDTACFRIGNIGEIYASDIDRLLLAIESINGNRVQERYAY